VLFRDIPHYAFLGLTTERNLGPLGQVWIAPFSPVGVDVYTFPQDRVSNTFQFADTLAWTRGSHSFKFGADVRRVQLNSRQDRNFRPVAQFSPAFGILGLLNPDSLIPGNPGTLEPIVLPLASGTDLASLGSASNVFQTFSATGAADSTVGLRFTEWNGFVQDDVRIRPNFTLNLGLRYVFTTVPQ
jgi:outer membrane receptor protein involved in Fe transport